MTRRKKPALETAPQKDIRQQLDMIADNATRNEKIAWNRKQANLQALVADLRPIEDKILDLMAQKLPIVDQIAVGRKELVETCVHPFEYLTTNVAGEIECKFCNKKFKIVNKP